MYFFCDKDRMLAHGDGRSISLGITHTVDPPLQICHHGLHASYRIMDALQYASGPILYKVRLGGSQIHERDKSCATERTYLKEIDATKILNKFARQCALSIIHLWTPSDAVLQYLKTGDEELKKEAKYFLWNNIWDLKKASDPKWLYIWMARKAAWASTMDNVAKGTRRAAWCVRDVLGTKTEIDKQNETLTQMVSREFIIQGIKHEHGHL